MPHTRWGLPDRNRPAKLGLVETQNPEPASSEMPAEDSVSVETPEGQLARLAEVAGERDRLVAETEDLRDRLQRAHAEFANARRRAERERADFLQFASMDLVKEILPILDDFERALKVETADRDYARGVELIYGRLLDTLRKMGLEAIETEGCQFDPNLHQAV